MSRPAAAALAVLALAIVSLVWPPLSSAEREPVVLAPDDAAALADWAARERVAGEPTVVRWCDAIDCEPPPSGITVEMMLLCCMWETHDCEAVVSLTDCHHDLEYAVICEWGYSTAAGVECYD